MPPDISVIIPTYRRLKPLVETIECVLSQTGVTSEIIVIDDCPNGSAEQAVAPYTDRGVTYLRTSSPSGGRPSLVRNIGWPRAKAEIIHFLDDDDLVPAGYYAEALQAFAQRPDVGVVFGKVEPFGDGDVSSERHYFEDAYRRARQCRRLGPKLGFSAAMFFQHTLLVCGAAMIRKRCVAAINGFDAGPSLAEDVDFYARAIRRFGAVLLDRTSLYYRIHPSLMRQPTDRTPLIVSSYQDIHSRYRREYGAFDFYAMKAFAKILGRFDANV